MPQKKQNKAQKNRKLTLEVMTQMLSLATSGFGLVAALAWNNVIQTFVNDYVKKFLPGNSGLFSLLLYAIIVTVLAVLVTLQLSAVKERLER